jgi:thiosulfate/3-mercaptopyruvate sulfurtransferase
VTSKIGLCAIVLCLTGAAMSDKFDDPWDSSELLAPTTLVAQLKVFEQGRHVICVGPAAAYRRAHVPNAILAGPDSKPKGLALLSEIMKNIPHDADLIVYCGCCPFVRCPNIRPAYRALKDMGYTHIRVLKLNTDLNTNWVGKGFPIDLSTN